MKHPLRDWRKLGECQKVIQHSPGGGFYGAVAIESNGLLAVTDGRNKCVHLLTKEGVLVRSIGERVLGNMLFGIAFHLKGNIWVAEVVSKRIVKLSQDGHFQNIYHAGSGLFRSPYGMSFSPEGLIYICDFGNCHVTVLDEEGQLLLTFGSIGSGPGCLNCPRDVAFGSDGLVYVSDHGNRRVCVWSKEGTFRRDFLTKYAPTCIAATSDNHLLITSYSSNFVLVYTLDGELVHEFGGFGVDPGRFSEPCGICVDDNGVVYVADFGNSRMQVF